MRKFFPISLMILSIIASGTVSPQDYNSIQISGGIISPMNSSRGLTGTVQFNYPVNPKLLLYVYTGYSAWDRYNISITIDHTLLQGETIFHSYSSDDHEMIPFFIGGRLDLHTNNLFTSYILFEMGYSYLRYNTYKNAAYTDPVTRKVLYFYPDPSTKKGEIQNLFGFGLGAGLIRPLSEELNLLLAYKLSSHINQSYNGFFSAKGTYSLFLAGFSFKL